MKKILFLFFVATMILSACGSEGNKAEASEAQEVETTETASTTSYATIQDGSLLEWRASHLGGVQPRNGKVYPKSAEILVNEGSVTNAKIEIDMATLVVENFPDAETNAKLTGHLKSGDFFNVETNPTSTFELTNLVPNEGEFNSVATGNLTINGVSKSITFQANVDVNDNQVAVKSEDFAIDRTEWGLNYNVEGTAGVPVDYLIANDVGFTIDVTVGK